MPLLKAEFTCEIITPMFLSGVNQATCELRAASLRGVLRYWYRALLGGQGVTGLEKLKEDEAAVFGSTEAASPVSIRVVPIDDLESKTRDPSSLPKWDGRPGKNQLRQNTGIGYLWFSITLGDNHRQYLEPGTRFKVIFSAIETGTVEQKNECREAMQNALRAFWLLEHFGGIGTRARRGAGSFWIRTYRTNKAFKEAGVAFPKFTTGFDDDNVKQCLDSWGVRTNSNDSSTPTLGTSRIVRQSLGASSWEDAIEQTGQTFKEYRLETKRASDPDRASFGLPLKLGLRNSERHLKLRYQADDKLDLDSDRRGSPLWIRIVPISGDPVTFDAVYTHFGGPFAEPNHRLKIEKIRGATSHAPLPNPGLIPEFLNGLDNQRIVFP